MIEQRWTKIIRPPEASRDLKLDQVWRYRDLITMFVHRNFVAQYKQTVLGPAWHFIQPLGTTVMFTIVFGKIAKIPTDGIPPFIFYLCGTILWGYFSSMVSTISSTFNTNAGLFGKIYFPRLTIPLSVIISRLIAFAIQFLFFICFLFYFQYKYPAIRPNSWILFSPFLLLLLAALALGIGILLSAMTTKYRDLAVLVGFGVQLLMYASPVIYPISSLPESWQFWASFNPVAPVIELFRYAFLGAGTVNTVMLLYSAATTLLIIYIGIRVFNRVERTFLDTV